MNYLYLILDISSILVPFIFSFHPKLNFYKEARAAWTAIVCSALVFIAWDMYFTHLGVWGFNPRYLSGIMFLNLPLEEVLFFVCIPYACLFTYHCFSVLINPSIFKKAENKITWVLLTFQIIIAIYSSFKLYTFYTFISLSVFLVVLKYGFKITWLNRFYFSYLILLLPFTVVNGILTGTGLDEPVVWYNNQENLGIRLLTIPVEDIFYGGLLILLNVSIFEYVRKKTSRL